MNRELDTNSCRCHCSRETHYGRPWPQEIILRRLLLTAIGLCTCLASAQSPAKFHQTFAVSIAEPVTLDVELSDGDLQIAYAREGEVMISARTEAPSARAPQDASTEFLVTEQDGNRVTIREHPHVMQNDTRPLYTIDVPYRTEIHAALGRGNISITGVMGPVTANVDSGNASIAYISRGVIARAVRGNVTLQVIGEHIDAKTKSGNITCTRAAQGISAETEDGDISLIVVGASQASVKGGMGRIEAEGVRGTLVASTAAGEIHARAVPHDNWHLSSLSGTVRVELPPRAGFEVEAMTDTGEVVVRRDDLEMPTTPAHQISRKANGGGKRIEIHSSSGAIIIG